ncbi:hypothetical protein SAMD00024442_10_14 [Candidatus Symbiothrix dinenymphae]|nr:hypothetical protein SAMD00024442_10_14 [Candidatus Symbiothrix dinenymphae]
MNIEYIIYFLLCLSRRDYSSVEKECLPQISASRRDATDCGLCCIPTGCRGGGSVVPFLPSYNPYGIAI